MDLGQEALLHALRTSYTGFLVASIAIAAVVKATVEFVALKAEAQMTEYLNLLPACS